MVIKLSKHNIKESFVSLTVREFRGINRTAVSGGADIAGDIKNFRILEDGSLEKRGGYSQAGELPEEIRSSWAGMLGGQPRLILLSEEKVYSHVPESGEYSQIGVVNTSAGEASFFMLEGRLYLKDGGGLYMVGEEMLSPAKGYIPLYGRDWPQTGGDVYEPINQLSEYIRIRYKITSNTSTVYTGFTAEQILQVRMSGVTYTSGFLNSGKNITLPATAYTGNIVDICIKIGYSFAERPMLDSCTGAAVYGGNYDTCVYCFAGNDKARVFRSRYVKKEDVLLSQSYLPESGELYFPVGDDYYVASGGAEVSAVCRHYDRLLIFGLDDTRMTELYSDIYQDTPAMPINTGVGCLNPGGVALCENDPVTISRDGIYRWTANTDERDESSAVKISAPLGDLMNRTYRESAFIFNYREKSEMWIGNPEDGEGRVFVYNYRTGKWYCFTNIHAERFFVYDGRIGFCCGGNVYLLDESSDDCGREINAVYESGYTDMGRPERDKRIKRCYLAGTGGGYARLELITPDGIVGGAAFICGEDSEPVRSGKRCPTRRFSHVKYRISAPGTGRQRIILLMLSGGK